MSAFVPTASSPAVSTKGFNRGEGCPRCKGKGFYLAHEGHGYYRDGSFGHNEWADCDHMPDDDGEQP